MYTIVITKTHEVEEIESGEWGLIGKEQDAVYGYKPPITKTVKRVTKIYEQSVEDNEIDVSAVVAVVNGLAGPR